MAQVIGRIEPTWFKVTTENQWIFIAANGEITEVEETQENGVDTQSGGSSMGPDSDDESEGDTVRGNSNSKRLEWFDPSQLAES